MATKKQTTTQRRQPADERPEPADDFDEETGADIEQFLSGQSEQAVVYVYKVGKPGERDAFIDTMSMAALQNPGPEQAIRDAFGAGNYRIKLKAPNKRGVLVYAGQKSLTIAERPGGTGNGNGRPHTIEEYYRQESDKTHQMLLAMIAATKPQTLDLGGLAALITAVTGGNKQSDLGAVVAAFATLKQTADPQTGLSQVKDVLEIAKSISAPAGAGGDPDADPGWPGLIRGALSALTGGAKPGQRRLPAPAGAGGPGDDDDEQPSEDEMFQRWLAGQLQFIKGKAAANKPVEFWIQYTIDNAEEPGNQAIFAALKGGATFENLLQFDPEIAASPALRVWFQKFYDGLKRSLSPAAPIPWIVGNPPDTTGNAIPGADRQPTADGTPGGGNPGKP